LKTVTKKKKIQMQCNDHVIKSQTKLKYLGLDIDQN